MARSQNVSVSSAHLSANFSNIARFWLLLGSFMLASGMRVTSSP